MDETGQNGQMGSRPPPRERLDPRAQLLWRVSAVVGALVVAGPIAAAVLFLRALGVRPPALAAVAAAVALVMALVQIWPVPDLTWRAWRYEIGETEVDLQSGWWTSTRSIVPMARIQHVDTRRGPLQRRFGLASLVLSTAAGSLEIPALAEATAARARDRIAALANLADDL